MNDTIRLGKKELLRLWNMVYNISLSMLHNPESAKDATQSIFIKVEQNLNRFKGNSKIDTWIYRIAYNYLITYSQKQKQESINFDLFERDVNNFTPYDGELGFSSEEEELLSSDIKVSCTLAMLQCLEPKQRFILVIGTIFGLNSRDASEICGISEENFRQRLSRVKKKIHSFMSKNCGKINPNAECHCRKRIAIAIQRGRLNSTVLASKKVTQTVTSYIKDMNEMDELAQIYRDNPFIETEDLFLSQLNQKYSILRDTILLHI